MTFNSSIFYINGAAWEYLVWEPGCPNGTWGVYSTNWPTHRIWMDITGFLLFTGLTGNGLTILVLLRSYYKAASSTVRFLLALAVSDSVYLLCSPLRRWLIYMIDVDIISWPLTCKLGVFFANLSYFVSNWILVAVSVERTLGVVKPHSVKTMCTRKTSCSLVCGITGALVLLNSHILFGHKVYIDVYGFDACAPNIGDYSLFWAEYWPWIHLFIACVMPFPFLAVGNGMIVVKLCRNMKKRKMLRMSSKGETSHNGAMRSITIVLVLLCIVFAISNTPYSVYLVHGHNIVVKMLALPCDQISEYVDTSQFLISFQMIVNIALYCSPTFNFIMYVASGKRFRRELLYILTCRRHESDTTELDVRQKETV